MQEKIQESVWILNLTTHPTGVGAGWSGGWQLAPGKIACWTRMVSSRRKMMRPWEANPLRAMWTWCPYSHHLVVHPEHAREIAWMEVCAPLQLHLWSYKSRNSKSRSSSNSKGKLCEGMTNNLRYPPHLVPCFPHLIATFQQGDATTWQPPSLPRQKFAHTALQSSVLHHHKTTKTRRSVSLCLWNQQQL